MLRKTFFCFIFVTLLILSACAPSYEKEIPTEPTDTSSDNTSLSEEASDTHEEVTTGIQTVNNNEIKFLVFSDLHYKKGMYIATVTDVKALMKRAYDEKVDFVIQLGDFCNDFKGSPELFDTYIDNEYGIPVYGVCGNHDMEGKGNTPEYISSLLCNRDVVFGKTSDNSQTAYWYTDIKNFRIIGLDTNYSYSPTELSWVRNKENTSHAPSTNEKGNSLGPEQLVWLENVIKDAEMNRKKVLVFSHVSFSDSWSRSPDAAAVRDIFSKYKDTVLMASNGHSHTDHFKVINSVAYFDVNSVRNGYWYSQKEHHYLQEHTYEFLPYIDGETSGNIKVFSLITLTQGKNTWFFKDPLSAVVSVSDDGCIDIKGKTTEWLYGVVPNSIKNGTKPMIGSYYYGRNK